MATSIQATEHDNGQEVTSLKDLAALLKAGPLPQGLTISLALVDELVGKHRHPTPEQAIALFKDIENKFPHSTLGEDKWYLVAVSAFNLRDD
jgi:hypothetical protein